MNPEKQGLKFEPAFHDAIGHGSAADGTTFDQFIHDAEAVYVEGNRRRRRRKPAIAPEKGFAPKLRGVISRELPMIEGERPGPPDSQACLRPHDRFGQRPPERRTSASATPRSCRSPMPNDWLATKGSAGRRRRTIPIAWKHAPAPDAYEVEQPVAQCRLLFSQKAGVRT